MTNLSNIDLKLLRVFVAVVHNGGFSLAQTELNVSQSTISVHLKNLETRLGMVLCQRGRSGFALTENGQRVYNASKALFKHIDDFQSTILDYEKLVGELHIGVIDNLARHPGFRLSNAIRAFSKLDHEVDITVHVAPPNHLEQLVLSGQAHMAVGFFPRRLSQLTYEDIFSSELELYCGVGHEFFDKPDNEIELEDIARAKHAQRGYVSYEQLPDQHRSFNYTARAHNIEGIAHLILSGDYIGFLPNYYAEYWIKRNQMRSIHDNIYRYISRYEIIRRKATQKTPAESIFYDLIIKNSA